MKKAYYMETVKSKFCMSLLAPQLHEESKIESEKS